ncbi:MAG: Cytosine-specific methyltransferase [Candidatus Yanofskybacteria bacterium GW2011_GWC2_41_9]|uniref:LexA repressor n=1 Tax=Candidatus Yanofskybacteria bacterium GW2011_GWC2_41_9 TaxID=1619029 RepID=A0A0G0XQY0_9BACT|nr:MAG: Cytosine-specific methyltransferase [Candidatus Yanofskybacteria bacterium GW2011_GWC2_41_9]
MANITKKQKQVFDFINSYISENGISPTIEEIRKKLKLRAVSTIHEHINTLKEKGYLSKSDNSARSISPSRQIKSVIEIPIVGRIAAGQPIEAIENREDTISLVNPNIKSSQGHYALRVIGESMIDEGIFNGDIVVIKKQSVAENGQTVVAIIDDNEATLKKLYKEKTRFRLEPRNQNMLPFFRKEVEVRGVVVQVIRNISTEEEKKPQKKTKHGFRTIDLFAGVGGIRIGFENAGFKTVFANDFEPQCKETYDLNFKDSKLVVEDIRKIGIDDLPNFDFLLGGFPCQPFSIAGYRQGFNDKKNRGNLFFDIVRIIDARKPEGFLLENVKNLKSHDKGNTFKTIEEMLKTLGYHVKTKVLNSMEYGNVPQNRERVYIVGFKNKDYYEKFRFPEPAKLTTKITDLLEKNVPEKYYYNGKPLFKKLQGNIKEEGKVYQWRRQYVRENKSGVCPTLTANMGTGGHNVPIIKDKRGIRKLTPLECARIQGFPADYKLPHGIADSALYKQFGNSVTVTVVESVAKQMMKAMNS